MLRAATAPVDKNTNERPLLILLQRLQAQSWPVALFGRIYTEASLQLHFNEDCAGAVLVHPNLVLLFMMRSTPAVLLQ